MDFFGIPSNLISSLIEKLLKYSIDKGQKQFEVHKLLSSYGLSELNESFQSIYLHSLIEFEKFVNTRDG